MTIGIRHFSRCVSTCFVALFLSVPIGSTAQNLDLSILQAINPSNPSSDYWRITANTSDPIAIALPAGLLVAGYAGHNKWAKRQGWKMVRTLAFNTLITQGFNYAIERERPFEQYPELVNAVNTVRQGKSFPSGQTSTAFSWATSLALSERRWYISLPVYAYAGSVGYAKLYSGENYPSDVLVGALVGYGSARLNHWINKRLGWVGLFR